MPDELTGNVAPERARRSGGLRALLPSGSVRLVLAAVALAGAAAFLHSHVLPRYEARATVLIDGASDRDRADFMAAQTAIMASTGVLGRVVADLGLERRPDFAAAPTWLGRALQSAGFGKTDAGLSGEARALEQLAAGLDIHPLDRVGAVAIGFSAREAGLAAAVPNAVAERYVALLQAAREQADPAAAAELAARIARQRAEVAALDARLAELRADRDAARRDASARPAELEAELARLDRERGTGEARAKALRAALGNTAALRANPDMQAVDMAAPYLEREAQLREEIAAAAATLLGNHPRIRALNAQLADARAQLATAARGLLTEIEAELGAIAERRAEAAAALQAIRDGSEQARTRDAEIAALEEQGRQARRTLETSLARQSDAAGLRADFLPATARVFQRATVPTGPVSVGGVTVAAVSFLAALALLFGLAMARARRRTARTTAMPVVGVGAVDDLEMAVPAAREAAHPVHALQELAAGTMEPVRRTIGEIGVVRAADKLIAGGAARAIFVSAEGDAGATASVEVARAVADAGLRVVLLDLTASGAVSRRMLVGAVRAGITNLLVAEAQFGDVIHADPGSTCHVIPVGTADPVRAMRAAERLPIILESLSSAYDLVVVECGAADAESIRRLVVDGTAVLLSAVEPSDAVAELALELADSGLGRPIIVAAAGATPAPRLHRSAA